MNRDAILAKSRAEKDDEGMSHVKARANSWALTATGLIAFSVYMYDRYHHNPTNAPVYAILSANVAADRFSMFLYARKKMDLLCAVLAAIVTVLALTTYFLGR